MTKAEERKVLAQIVALIDSTPMDSYIRMAFLNVPDYAERNIADDAGYNPVAERDMWEKRCYEKDCELQKTAQKLLRLEHENQALSTHLDEKDAEIAKLNHLLESKSAECNRIAEERDAMADCVDGSNEIIDKAEAEIRRLKAEIVRMRMERMTDADMEKLYDKMEGEE